MVRKTTDGEIRNKERTKLKLINAVGEIIQTQGYTKLGVNNIANKAEVSKKLIYRYFGTVDHLIELYVKGKDYWIALSHEVNDLVKQHGHNHGKDLVPVLLENLFENLINVPETQKISLWEISEASKLMQDVHAKRGQLGTELFSLMDPLFEKTEVEIRSVCALLLGGIYYLVLHSNGSGGPFCEIDIKTEKGKQHIVKGIKDVISWTYKEAARQKSANKKPA